MLRIRYGYPNFHVPHPPTPVTVSQFFFVFEIDSSGQFSRFSNLIRGRLLNSNSRDPPTCNFHKTYRGVQNITFWIKKIKDFCQKIIYCTYMYNVCTTIRYVFDLCVDLWYFHPIIMKISFSTPKNYGVSDKMLGLSTIVIWPQF